jgi:prepilin-type N-terminal cleavage/methylation domain-containing protein
MKPTVRLRGFTLVELLVVVAVVAVILTLAAPSFRSMIEMQRLRSITSQLVTDLQFARNEAVQRNTLLRVSFEKNDDMTCYTLYTSPALGNRCDCRYGAGSACKDFPDNREVRTVQILASLAVKVEIPASEFDTAFAFDNVTGGLYVIPTDGLPAPWNDIAIETCLDAKRKLAVRLSGAGRPTVCTASECTMSDDVCPQAVVP